MIAPGSSRNSSKESYGSNDMPHNYYLKEAKKKTQDRNRNLKPREMPPARTHHTPKACTPKPRSNNQTFRNWPAKSSDVTWVPTGKIFTSSTTKVDNELPNGLDEDVTYPYECEQTRNGFKEFKSDEQELWHLQTTLQALLLKEKKGVHFISNGEMASEQSSSGPALYEMTLRIINSGLVQNPPSITPYVPPTKNNWDMLFQPMFDEHFNPPLSVVSLVHIVAAPRPADLTGVEEQLQPAQLVDDPFLDLLTLKPSSYESSSTVQPTNPPLEHISKWMKIHPLEN
ncbi:hypothetical protein Tco_0202111 [Tanacetum coccineum]